MKLTFSLILSLFLYSQGMCDILPPSKGAELPPMRVYDNFYGGLNTTDPPHKLLENQSPYLRNVIIDDGGVETWPGTVLAGSSATLMGTKLLFEFVKPSGEKEYIVSDSSIVLTTTDFLTYTMIRSGLNKSYKLRAMQVEDKVWFYNGNNSEFTYNGVTVTVLDGGNYNLGKTPNVPIFKYMAYYQNRVWGFNNPNNTSLLRWSTLKSTHDVPVLLAPDNENAWGNVNFALSVDKGNGTQATWIKVFRSQLFLGKERGISVIFGDDDTEYIDVPVIRDYGFVSNDSIAEIDNSLLGYGGDGIYQFTGSQFNRISDNIIADMEAVVNNIGNTQTLRWDSKAEFNRGTVVGTTVTDSGRVTVNFSTYVLVSTPAQAGDVTDQFRTMLPVGSTSTGFVSITTNTARMDKVYQVSSGAISDPVAGLAYVTNHLVLWGRSINSGTVPDGLLRITLKNLRTGSTAYYQQTSGWGGGLAGLEAWHEIFVPFAGDSGIKELIFTGNDILNGNLQLRLELADSCSNGSPNCRFDLRYSSRAAMIFLKDSQIVEYVTDVGTTTNLSMWGTFSALDDTAQGRITYAYRAATSTVNIATYPFIPISIGGLIGATPANTFIQIISTLTFASTSSVIYIDKIEATYNQGGASDVNPFGVAWRGRYYLAVTTTVGGDTSLIYVRSRNTSQVVNAFTVLEGLNVKAFLRTADVFYAGASTSGLVYRMEEGTNYDGKPINAIYDTREDVFGNPFYDKKPYSYFVDCEKQSASTLRIGTSVNRAAFSFYPLSTDGTGRMVKYLPYPSGNGNSFRFRLENVNQADKRMKVNYFGIAYLPNAKITIVE